ncbi:MAG: DUF255 domain-containing protein, partial [Gloeobacteraceae cyanobacterium ES-bin-144]|nr:DUF255 domain-containing protein [Verrucomicrobiales bacterium]
MMNFQIPSGAATATIVLCGLLLGTGGCRKKKVAENTASQVVVASELASNALGSLPSSVYQSQANLAIHWQPWTKASLSRAKAANRLVFGVIAMPQLPGFQAVLESLAKNPDLVAVINDEYVPVLIDGDASREMGLLAADLCGEIKRGLQMPLFVWMTPDGNPVAWMPVTNSNTARVSELFYQSHSMVSRLWTDDAAYITKNSSLDNAARRERISQRKNTKTTSEKPAE